MIHRDTYACTVARLLYYFTHFSQDVSHAVMLTTTSLY